MLTVENYQMVKIRIWSLAKNAKDIAKHAFHLKFVWPVSKGNTEKEINAIVSMDIMTLEYQHVKNAQNIVMDV